MDKKIVDLTYPFTKTTQHWPTAKPFHLEKVAEGRTPKSHGRIGASSIVLAHTGWGQYWSDRKRYFGTDEPENVTNIHFLGLSKEITEFLVKQRSIKAVGIDTPSIDHGPSQTFPVHQILGATNVPIFENFAAMERLPAKPATIFALPMKIAAGSGAPLRIFAILP